MHSRGIVFVFFAIAIIAVKLNSCDRSYSSPRINNLSSYQCEGTCVPVYLNLHVPPEKSLYSRVYISGSFNGWRHADPELELEQVDKTTYRTTVLLPEGEGIKYRYTVARDQKYGFAEYGDLRAIKVMDGNVRRDSIAEWGEGVLTSTLWTPDKLERKNIQGLFLDKHLVDLRLTDPVVPSKVDSMFEAAEKKWAEEGALFYSGYDRLLSTAYSSLYHLQMMIGNHAPSKEAECHMAVNYVLPALMDELAYVEGASHAARYSLLGNYSEVVDAIYCDGLSGEEMGLLYELYHSRIPDLIALAPADIDTTYFNEQRLWNDMSPYKSVYASLRSTQTGKLTITRRKDEATQPTL